MLWIKITRIGRTADRSPLIEPLGEKPVLLPVQVGAFLGVLSEFDQSSSWTLTLLLNRETDGMYSLYLGTDNVNLTRERLIESLARHLPGSSAETANSPVHSNTRATLNLGVQIDLRPFEAEREADSVPLDNVMTALSPGSYIAFDISPISESNIDDKRKARVNQLKNLKPEKSDHALIQFFTRPGSWVAAEEKLKQEVILRELAALGIQHSETAPGFVLNARTNSRHLQNSLALILRARGTPAEFRYDEKDKKLKNTFKHSKGGLATAAETAALLALPSRSLPGLPVVQWPEIGGIPASNQQGQAVTVGTGSVFFEKITIPLPAFREHLVIAGTTGSGKTTTTKTIITQLRELGIPVTVLASAKGEEYETVFPGEQVFRLGAPTGPTLRFNPLAVPEGIDLSRHIDGVKAAFVASFSMEGPLPQLFERVLYRAYESAGWDLPTGHSELAIPSDGAGKEYMFPTLADMLRLVPAVAQEAQYGQEITQNVVGALSVRLRSLCTGLKGRVFNTRLESGIDHVSDKSGLIRLDELGNDEDKAFMISHILLRLEYSRHLQKTVSSKENPTHVLVIEEAHRVLRNPGSAQGGEGNHTQKRAIESFANLLAELRSYGEGVVIVDQSPSELVPAVLKNSNTKIFHRLVENNEAKVAAGAIGLAESDASCMVALEAGEALYLMKGMPRPSLIRVRR